MTERVRHGRDDTQPGRTVAPGTHDKSQAPAAYESAQPLTIPPTGA
jgi:hypothetical protein